MMIEEPPKETKHNAPKPKRKLKKKERKEYIKYKILTSRKPQNETTQMLTKERGRREGKPKRGIWVTNGPSCIQIQCASYQEMVDQLSATWRREKRESETRSDVSDLGHLCYLNTYTLWTMDPWRGSPTKLLWPSHGTQSLQTRVGQWPLHGTQSLQTERAWVSGNRVDWDKTDMTGIWSGPMSMKDS